MLQRLKNCLNHDTPHYVQRAHRINPFRTLGSILGYKQLQATLVSNQHVTRLFAALPVLHRVHLEEVMSLVSIYVTLD